MCGCDRSLQRRYPFDNISLPSMGVGDDGKGGTCPLKIREKYFSGNYYVKFGHFSGKNHVKFGNFVNFSGKYYKNFSGTKHAKVGHFVHFSYIFFGQKYLAPKVD